MTLWDYIEKRRVEVGSERWVAYWWTLRDGFGPDSDFDPIEDVDDHCRIFPTRALARAFAKKIEDYWSCPMIRQEVFMRAFDGCGEWETVERTIEEVC